MLKVTQLIGFGAGGISPGIGYLLGGSISGGATTSIAKFDFTTKVRTNLSATLAYSYQWPSAFFSTAKGYGTFYNFVIGVTFSSETSFTSSTIPSWRYDSTGYSYPSTAGYTVGGRDSSAVHNTMQKVLYSTGATSTLGATLQTARQQMAGSQSTTRGYSFAGMSFGTTKYTEVDGLIFSGETATNPSAAISGADSGKMAAGNKIKAAIVGGWDYTTSTQKFTFSSYAIANISDTLNIARSAGAGMGAGSNGYFAGGGGYLTSIEGINMSTEVTFSVTATLSPGTQYSGGVTNRGTNL